MSYESRHNKLVWSGDMAPALMHPSLTLRSVEEKD